MKRWLLTSWSHMALAAGLALLVFVGAGVTFTAVRLHHVAEQVSAASQEAKDRAASSPSATGGATQPPVDTEAPRKAAEALVPAWAAGDADALAGLMMPGLLEEAGDAPEGLEATGPAVVTQGGAALAVVVVPTTAGDLTLSMIDLGAGTWRAQSLLLAD